MLKEFNLENFKLIKNNEINLNVYCDGIGPLVIMAHGWPESWYSWSGLLYTSPSPRDS